MPEGTTNINSHQTMQSSVVLGWRHACCEPYIMLATSCDQVHTLVSERSEHNAQFWRYHGGRWSTGLSFINHKLLDSTVTSTWRFERLPLAVLSILHHMYNMHVSAYLVSGAKSTLFVKIVFVHEKYTHILKKACPWPYFLLH